VISVSKGIFLRLQGETYEHLKKEAQEKGVTVPSLIKNILSKYADGTLKFITPEEETLLKTTVELIPVKDKVEKLETYINEYLKPYIDEINKTIKKVQDDALAYRQIIDHVMVLEQKANSLEIRIRNLEKSKR
jgi:hypothetical protein